MPETAQTTALIQAELMGLTATIEKHTKLVMKRRNSALRNVPGDGRNRIEHIHDPVLDMEEVTLTLNAKQSNTFIKAARRMLEQQAQDPSLAQPLKLYSYGPNSSIVDKTTAVLAVIQAVHMPEGDTNAHGLASAEIVVQPLRMEDE